MDVREKIKQVLLTLDLADLEVKVLDEYPYRVVAVVISTTFEKMSDGDRQHMIWRKLLESLTDREQEWVEFVFTKTPAEWRPSSAGAVVSVAEAQP